MNQYEAKMVNDKIKIFKGEDEMKSELSLYTETTEEKEVRGLVRNDFTDSYVAMYKPRTEFNDDSLITRTDKDNLSWNTYQVGDGDGYEQDISDAWRSRAIRPIVRNKCVSISAHATARLIFPKIFARNSQSEEQKDAAQVMRDLIEYSADQSNYKQTALFSVIGALSAPASITYTEYSEVHRRIKSEKVDGKWEWKEELDEERSGFKDVIVPVNQLFIENFYEKNIQNQGFIIWRRVQSYTLMAQRYGHLDQFKYVQKGVRVFYNDANDTFYNIYDDEIEDRLCEEILYWNKSRDLFLTYVNGILISEADNPNSRKDKLYPFVKTGYEIIGNGNFFYYKDLAFKLKPDADIINTLYPMIIDGSYLSIMPPLVNSGDANVDNSVIIPGAMTSLGEGNDVKPIQIQSNLNAGIGALQEVEKGVGVSSEMPLIGANQGKNPTAYEMALREKERQTILGGFVDMIGQWVNDYNQLRIGDILQYLTIGKVDKILDNAPLVYRTFLLPEKMSDGKSKTRRIDLDGEMKDNMTDKEYRNKSFDLLGKGGEDTEICKVNPSLFRELKFMAKTSPDVMNPVSEELEKAYGVEAFDRSIQAAGAGVRVDLEKAFKDFILSNNSQSKSNPDEYIMEQELEIPNLENKGGMVNPSEKVLKQQPQQMRA